ncbi:S8 family peptidase [Amycolatopsis nigrescens]|uniref:S8 family peptidase n=1 Tax=Amycolatopsis nigrescens TaxID=381445 RepID=UPI0003705268|nr:S8 family peptidase [Amycolatopsis nigrescens]
MQNAEPGRARSLCKGLLISALGMGLAVGGAVANAQPAPAEGQIITAGAQEAVAGSYIVGLKGSSAGAGDLVARYGGQITQTYTAALQGFAVSMNEQQAKRLAADPRVAYVEQDGAAHLTGTQTNPTWGLDRIDQKALPLDKKYTYPNEGAGVTVYVVDTGTMLTHPDFGDRVKSGYDFIDNDSNSSDCHGHGTHVAGTVGSSTYGVAKKVNIVGVRVLNCSGSGQNSQVVAGIDWVTKNAAKPAVLSMSLGGGANTSVDSAVRRAVQAGITTTVASGNSNTDACNTSPARAPEAITVNATDSNDGRASFSNYGRCTDIFAPGVSILSTKNGGGTATMSGTSMATPHVAGAAAVYLSANPSATPAQVDTALKNGASDNVVKNPGSGSTNKLLNVVG